MPLECSHLEALDFHTVEYLSCLEVADFESRQLVDVHVTAGLHAVGSQGRFCEVEI